MQNNKKYRTEEEEVGDMNKMVMSKLVHCILDADDKKIVLEFLDEVMKSTINDIVKPSITSLSLYDYSRIVRDFILHANALLSNEVCAFYTNKVVQYKVALNILDTDIPVLNAMEHHSGYIVPITILFIKLNIIEIQKSVKNLVV